MQSVLCEDVLRVKRTVVEGFRYTDLTNKCYCLQKGCKQREISSKQLFL